MGLFGRLKTGLQLARRSIDVLRDHPQLAVFPGIAGVAGVAYLAVLWLTLLGADLAGAAGGANETTLYVGLFVFYLGSTFIASFFTAGMMYCTRQAMHGESPSVGAGLRAASRHVGPLFVWSVISALVGVVLRALEESDTPAAQLVGVVFSVGWSIMTYFVVPVIVFEDVGIRGMFSRSKDTVVETWGESLGAAAGVGLVTIAFGIVGALLGALLFVLLPGGAGLVGLLVIVAAVLLAGLLGQTLTGIAKVALYVYATEEQAPAYFEGVDFGDEGGSGGRSRGLGGRFLGGRGGSGGGNI